jgi:hypothetical protein
MWHKMKHDKFKENFSYFWRCESGSLGLITKLYFQSYILFFLLDELTSHICNALLTLFTACSKSGIQECDSRRLSISGCTTDSILVVKHMTKHYLIFIHGMGEGSPTESYNQLWEHLINASQLSSSAFESKFESIHTAWHTPPLSTAAKAVFNQAFPTLEPQFLNPMKYLRDFMTFYLGDIIAYVSEDVNFIRRRVWQGMWPALRQPLLEGASYSLIAHSLGSVIAFDYVFNLLVQGELFIPNTEPVIESVDLPTPDEMNLLKKQMRHLFTFGSPIGLFMLRKGELWMTGNPFEQLINPLQVEGQVWLNFWDSEDPIAYPLSELFQLNPSNQGSQLIDIPVETGFLIVDSHTKYWENTQIAKEVMKVLQN